MSSIENAGGFPQLPFRSVQHIRISESHGRNSYALFFCAAWFTVSERDATMTKRNELLPGMAALTDLRVAAVGLELIMRYLPESDYYGFHK